MSSAREAGIFGTPSTTRASPGAITGSSAAAAGRARVRDSTARAVECFKTHLLGEKPLMHPIRSAGTKVPMRGGLRAPVSEGHESRARDAAVLEHAALVVDAGPIPHDDVARGRLAVDEPADV